MGAMSGSIFSAMSAALEFLKYNSFVIAVLDFNQCYQILE